MQKAEEYFDNAGKRFKRYTAVNSNYGESDYENLWEDIDREFIEINDEIPKVSYYCIISDIRCLHHNQCLPTLGSC